MSDKKKLTTLEREKQLIEKIEEAKRKLSKLQNKKKSEIGALACKHKLDSYDLDRLDKAFAKLSKELQHEHSTSRQLIAEAIKTETAEVA